MTETAITIITCKCIPEKPNYLKDCLTENIISPTENVSDSFFIILDEKSIEGLIPQIAQKQKITSYFCENTLILKTG